MLRAVARRGDVRRSVSQFAVGAEGGDLLVVSVAVRQQSTAATPAKGNHSPTRVHDLAVHADQLDITADDQRSARIQPQLGLPTSAGGHRFIVHASAIPTIGEDQSGRSLVLERLPAGPGGYLLTMTQRTRASSQPGRPRPPEPRGALSAALLRALRHSPESLAGQSTEDLSDIAQRTGAGPVENDDFQLSLWLLYQLHYRGLAEIDDRWEWHPSLMSVTRILERPFEQQLRALAAPHLPADVVEPDDVPQALADVIRSADGPSLSSYLARHATREQFAEFLVHRSVYHLIEADPHSWAIPRLSGAPKVALVEIQADEYGGGRPEWMHAQLFADTMEDFGLDTTYASYVDVVPALTLLWVNTMSLFGLHRRLRGAACGHLAALEMTSSLPNRRYGNGLRRLGLSAPSTTCYFDEHVEADAVHEQIAAHDLAAALARQDSTVVTDILFGAACAVLTDAAVATHLLERWKRHPGSPSEGRASLIPAGSLG
jgi:hypothetical protein